MSTRGETGPEATGHMSIWGEILFLPVASFLLFHLFSKHIKVYADLFHTDTCIWKFLSNKQDILFKQPPPGFKASPEPRRANHGAANQPSSPGRSRTWMSGLRPPEPRRMSSRV